jgi:hypothetical protein
MRIRSLYWPVFRGRPLLPLLLFLAAFFVLEFAYPRFQDQDAEIFLKSAGRNISHGGAFAAPELEGFDNLNPPLEQIYYAQTPLYPWLFGQLTRATGFGWAVCVGYDALISAVLAFIVYGLAGAVADTLIGPLSVPRRTALALVPALLTLLFRQVARPDELGMVLGFGNAWWLFLPRTCCPRWPVVTFVSGMLAGLMFCASVAVFSGFLPFLTALWLRRVDDIREIAPSLAAAGLGGGLALALPLFLVDPHFYQYFLQYVQLTLREHNDYYEGIAGTLSDAWPFYRQYVFIAFATLPVLCLGMITLWRTGRVHETLALFVAPLLGFGVSPWSEKFYLWFFQPWFLLVAIVVAADFWWNRRSRLLATVLVGWLAIWLAIASAWPVKDYLVRITLAPEQRLAPNVRKLRELIPMGSGVLATTGWWALGNDRSVYDALYSNIQDLARIEYFVTTGNDTGQPGVWVPPGNPRYNAMVRESFEVISNTLPRTPLRVFGIRITNSAYGFGTVVLRRVPAQPQRVPRDADF